MTDLGLYLAEMAARPDGAVADRLDDQPRLSKAARAALSTEGASLFDFVAPDDTRDRVVASDAPAGRSADLWPVLARDVRIPEEP